MYHQPRRVSDAAPAESAEESTTAAFNAAPRRAAQGRVHLLRTRLAPTAVSLALLAATGGFALSVNALQGSQTAVPAPVRGDGTTTRDLTRNLVSTQDGATADAADAAGAEGSDAAPAEGSETAAAEGSEATAEGSEAFVLAAWQDTFGEVSETLYAQKDLTVRAGASDDTAELGTLSAGDKVSATDKSTGDYRQISYEGQVAYVKADLLGKTEPRSDVYSGSTEYTGPTVLGLKPRAMVVYNAVMARWGGEINSVGGYRATSLSNHQYGGAIDFMLTPGAESAMGWEIAKYVTANASAFKIDHVIFEQKIWTPNSPYWRPMANRGSTTANHYDHVHVSVKL